MFGWDEVSRDDGSWMVYLYWSTFFIFEVRRLWIIWFYRWTIRDVRIVTIQTKRNKDIAREQREEKKRKQKREKKRENMGNTAWLSMKLHHFCDFANILSSNKIFSFANSFGARYLMLSYNYNDGQYGSAPGQFNRPTGMCVDDLNTLMVVEFINHRVQFFDWLEFDLWWLLFLLKCWLHICFISPCVPLFSISQFQFQSQFQSIPPNPIHVLPLFKTHQQSTTTTTQTTTTNNTNNNNNNNNQQDGYH